MEFKEVLKEYNNTNSQIKNRIVTISVLIIGAIFVIFDKKIGLNINFSLYKWAFLSFIFSLTFEFLNLILHSIHIEKYIEERIKSLDYRETWAGKFSEYCFWIMVSFFILGSIIFVTAIFRIRIV